MFGGNLRHAASSEGIQMAVYRSTLLLAAILALAACEPTVKVEAPKEPITINLNVKIDAEVRVKLEEQAQQDIKNAPDIF
jgi:hypothetical protein